MLEVVSLIFNEGYAASSGEEWTRPALCADAMRLGRVLARLAPEHSEVHGLVALMELQASRLPARTGPDGRAVLLADQDRARWDRVLLQHGLGALEKAHAAARAAAGGRRGRYLLQAALAAEHARARSFTDTDWSAVAALYAELGTVAPSPVVELNRAVAVGRAEGPAAGLAVLDTLRDHPAMARYHLLPAVRADLLLGLGRPGEAAAELERALTLVGNAAERELLARRLAALRG